MIDENCELENEDEKLALDELIEIDELELDTALEFFDELIELLLDRELEETTDELVAIMVVLEKLAVIIELVVELDVSPAPPPHAVNTHTNPKNRKQFLNKDCVIDGLLA